MPSVGQRIHFPNNANFTNRAFVNITQPKNNGIVMMNEKVFSLINRSTLPFAQPFD